MQPGLHAVAVSASGGSGSSIEFWLLGFAGFMLVLVLVVRAKRSHDQKLRRAASSGFYDFDVAHYGADGAGSSLIEKAVASGARPLAPSFVSPQRGDGRKVGGAGAPATMPEPSSFGAVDRSRTGPVPVFDQIAARDQRPPPPVPVGGNSQLPIPSAPALPPREPGMTSSLPTLEQPPPPRHRPSADDHAG
jgi:hypothetical protein